MRVVPDEPEAPTAGVRIDGRDYQPTANTPEQDFLPADVAAVLLEKNPTLRQNAARALRAAVLSAMAMQSKHLYWNANAGDYAVW